MPSSEFLPRDLDSWIGLIVKAGGLIVTISTVLWKLFINPIRAQVNGLGSRLDAVSSSCTTNTTRIDQIDRQHEIEEFQRQAIMERLGRLEGLIEKNTDAITKQNLSVTREDGIVSGRLLQLEAKVDNLTKLVERSRT